MGSGASLFLRRSSSNPLLETNVQNARETLRKYLQDYSAKIGKALWNAQFEQILYCFW